MLNQPARTLAFLVTGADVGKSNTTCSPPISKCIWT